MITLIAVTAYLCGFASAIVIAVLFAGKMDRWDKGDSGR
jgi:hypothetical protein